MRRGERCRPLGDLLPSPPNGWQPSGSCSPTFPPCGPQIGKIVTRKVDKLSCVRFGSARYSVPNDHIGKEVSLRIRDGVIQVVFLGEIVAEHLVVSPGETSINDDHYGGPRPMPRRLVRPRSTAEKTFCALGPVADAFIKGAAARGHDRSRP